MRHLSYIEIDQRALVHNFETLKLLCPAAKTIVSVVKANAYGHGLNEVVAALEGRTDYFGVDDIEELIDLRRVSKQPALVLGYVPDSRVAEVVAMEADLAVYDTKRLPSLQHAAERLGHRARVHVKVDALLGRQGLLPDDVKAYLDEIKLYSDIDVVAVYSHFGNIEDTTDLTHANAQSAEFERATPEDVERHESATSGAMALESAESKNSWVRFGIGLYGLYPSPSLARRWESLELRPVMRWVSHLAQVKTLPPKHPVGYGLTYITSKETRIGIVPQGYSDGYDRGLSNSGTVLVHGMRCPVLGRIAMNMFAIDLSDVPEAQAEDEVVLLGTQGDERISAEEIAQKTGTINYEVVARISPLLPRVTV